MASTGSVSSWDESLLVAMIQYPVPVITGPADIQTQVDLICKAVASTKAGYPEADIIVMPEYSTQGLNTAIWTYATERSDKFDPSNSNSLTKFAAASLLSV